MTTWPPAPSVACDAANSQSLRRSKIATLTLLSVAGILCIITTGLLGRSLSVIAALDNTAGFVGALLGLFGAVAAVALSISSLKVQRKRFSIAILSISCVSSLILFITSIITVSLGDVPEALSFCGDSGYYYYYEVGSICSLGIGAIFTWLGCSAWLASIIPASMVVREERIGLVRQSSAQPPAPMPYVPLSAPVMGTPATSASKSANDLLVPV